MKKQTNQTASRPVQCRAIGRLGRADCGIAVLLLLALALWSGISTVSAQAIRTGPSAFCHTPDGAFTDCDPVTPGIEEWSDIDFLSFNDANVFTDQRVGAAPALFLMYDLVNHKVPLGPTEAITIRFDSVEDGEFEHYEVQCFGNGSMIVLANGVPEDPDGIVSGLGFSDHVRLELEIPMDVVYSPDIPLFWSASAPAPRNPPPPPNCPSNIPPAICSQCRTNPASNPTLCCTIFPELCNPSNTLTSASVAAGDIVVSSTITQANSDGTTTVVAVPPEGPKPGDLCVIVGNLIDSLCPPTFAYKNHGAYVSLINHKTAEAVASLVNSGVITAAEGEDLKNCVVNPRARSKVGKPK